MNPSAEESLMALLEAMLTLAAGGAEARRQPVKPPVNPGGYPEDQFLDLSEQEKEELSCNICYQILKETMQCVNNHKFCHSCLVVWSTTGQYANRIRCPVCRTRGYYFRNDEMDDRVGAKKVKCHMETCSWTGLAKYLNSHRHNTYGNESQSEAEASKDGGMSTSTSMPRLAQLTPRAPPTSTARFVGTGLTTQGPVEALRPAVGGSGLVPLYGGAARTTSRASTSSLSSASQETIIDLNAPSGISGNNTGGAPSSSITAASRRVPPIRSTAAGNGRITFSHTRANNRDANNNIGGAAVVATTTTAAQTSNQPLLPSRASSLNNAVGESSEGIPITVPGALAPRPPSAPRTNANTVNTRRLPRIVNPQAAARGNHNLAVTQPSAPPTQEPSGRSTLSVQPASSLSPSARNQNPASSLSEIRDHLQDSRSRLNNLMSSFSGELDRSRQEMMEFQQQRERQRREQLQEVRELGQRLGQVAFELRRLLEQRRQLPNFSDSDDDSDL